MNDSAFGHARSIAQERVAEEPGRWRRPVGLLLLLALIPGILLFLAYSESRESAAMAGDINLSGFLRYRSLYLYAVRASAETESRGEQWPVALEEMGRVYEGLHQRHPAETSHMRAGWEAFRYSLQHSGHVSWAAAERMRIEADALTNALTIEAVKRSTLSDQLFWAGTLCLALSLPWSVHLISRLQMSQEEISRHIRQFAELSSRFQDVFQNTPTACFVYDQEGRLTEWNRSAEVLFEKSAAQVKGLFLWDVIARPSRRETTRETVERLLAGESFSSIDWIYETPNGVSKTVTSSVIPMYTNGIITGAISASTDVTATRAAAESERALMAELAASEEHLRNVTSRSSCLLWEADVSVTGAEDGYKGPLWDEKERTCLNWDLRVLHDEVASRWLPIYREPGQSFGRAWQASMPDDEVREMDVRARDAIKSGADNYSQEFPCRLADGSTQWLMENVKIRRIEGESPRWHIVGVCTNISAQRESAEKLKSLAAELQRSNSALQEFAYVASHDLKEPLRKIQSFGGIVKKRSENLLPADCVDYLSRMVSASVRMQTLVDGLLDYARASRRPRALTQIDLNNTIQDVLTDLEEQIASTNGRVVVGRLPVICTDRMQMGQLFQNLISNALKFHKPGQGPLVTVTWDDEDAPVVPSDSSRTVQISVSDDGVGFQQRYAEPIFEIFEQLEAGSVRGKGTGVGLTICRTIVECYGGTITASSVPGQGSKFTIVIPVGA